MHRFIIAPVLVFLPAVALAQNSIQSGLVSLMNFINQVVIPAILGIAFLVFVVNAVRYFIVQGANEDGRAKARSLVVYSLSAFVAILLFYGLVNLLVGGVGATNPIRGGTDYSVPDYLN